MADERDNKYEYLSATRLEEYRDMGLDEQQIQKANDIAKRKIEERVRSYVYPFEECNESLEEINVVIIGKTGVGKSSLGNSLLGKNCFKRSAAMRSETKTIGFQQLNLENTILKIIDTPGFMDTEEDDIQTEVAKVLEVFPGIHVFLVVLNMASTRFTAEDVQTMEDIQDIFGEEIFKHAIVVFTKAAAEIGKGSLRSFKDYIDSEKSKTSPIHRILDMCNFRTVAYENVTETVYEEDQQRQNLMALMMSTVHQAAKPLYDNELFQDVQKRTLENKKKKIEANIIREIRAHIGLCLRAKLERKSIGSIYNAMGDVHERRSLAEEGLDYILNSLKTRPENIKYTNEEFWKKENFTPILEDIDKAFSTVAMETIKNKSYEALAKRIKTLHTGKVLKHHEIDVMLEKVMNDLPPSLRKNLSKEEVRQMIERMMKESLSEIELKTQIINFICVDPHERGDQNFVFEQFKSRPDVHEICNAEGLNLRVVVEECFHHSKVQEALKERIEKEKKVEAQRAMETIVNQVVMKHVLQHEGNELRKMQEQQYENQMEKYLDEVKSKLTEEWLTYLPDSSLKEAISTSLDMAIDNVTKKSWLDRLRKSRFDRFILGNQSKK